MTQILLWKKTLKDTSDDSCAAGDLDAYPDTTLDDAADDTDSCLAAEVVDGAL